MADQQQDEVGVDASSPNPLQRRNSLEKHLQTRPEEQDLKNRHILLDTTAAPALQAKQAELERQRITDNLKKVQFTGMLCSKWILTECLGTRQSS